MPYHRSDDALAQAKKEYYRKHRDLSPQSTWSRVLETVGLDEPFAPDARSYDYRQQAWDESQAQGNPDMSWFLPELSDETKDKFLRGTEEATGGLVDAIPAIAGAATNWGDKAIKHYAGGLNPGGFDEGAPVRPYDLPPLEPTGDKFDPFPEEWKGTNERKGDPGVGALAYGLDQLNYTPWDTAQVLSVFGQDAPDTVQRDMDRFTTANPEEARAIDIGGTAALFPAELALAGRFIGKGAKAAAKGAKRVASAARRKLTSTRDAVDELPVPKTTKAPDFTNQPPPQAEGSLRKTINRAFTESGY